MNRVRRWQRWRGAVRVAALVGLSVVVLTDCPMPFTTTLRKMIDERVAGQAEIGVFVAGVEIPDGGATDAFSPAVQAQPMDVVFTVRNTGIGALVFREESPVELSGADAALFTVLSQPSTANVAPQGSAEFTVRFLMDSPGVKTSKINLYTNDADESPYEINISNTALPEIQVLQNGTEIASGTGTANIGTTQYGSYRDVVFTIKNLGKANLDLVGSNPVSISGVDFSVLSQASSPVAPGSSTTFTVRHTPVSPGACVGGISVASSDADENPFDFGVSAASELQRSVVRIAASSEYSVARRSDGAVWAWGYNGSGQLGDDTTTDRHAPVHVPGLAGVAAIAAKSSHTVALGDDGTVWAWGSNSYGQIGDGTQTDRWTAVQVKGPGGVGWLAGMAAIAAGTWHTVALKSDGTVWAWGENGAGQLGDGTQTDRWTPDQVPGLTGVIAIASGNNFAVALKSDGTVWAWGSNGDGQLGDGTYAYRLSPVQVKSPDGLGWLTDIAAIAAGSSHTVALKNDWTVWAWGYNNSGQLGDDTLTKRTLPVQVKSPDGLDWLTGVGGIAAGANHTVALKSDETVWAWGANAGQLGDGTTTPHRKPVQVKSPDGLGWLTGVGGIAAGGSHTVAFKSDGTVWAWGANIFGQVGDASTTDRLLPTQVSGLIGAAGTAGGASHSVMQKSDGTVWAWGDNGFWAIGDGTNSDRLVPVQASGLTGVTAVAAGRYHTVALKSDGTVWTWGSNTYGQLGDGTTTGHNTAVQVKGAGGTGWLTDVAAIAAGDYFTVAVLADDGSVWAWGRNYQGQLGDDSTTDSPTPVQVKDTGGTGWLTGVAAIAAGSDHAVARMTDGTVWAWGNNGWGQLGNDSSPFDSLTPVQVKDAGGTGVLSGIAAVAAGSEYTVALAATGGGVWAWGYNGYGQLGDGTTTASDLPVQTTGLTGVAAIGAGVDHTVAAIASDGTVWAWGRNTYGQLGDGTTTASSVPVQVKGPGGVGSLADVATVAGGDYHSLARMADGTARAWGYNNNGQLGDGTTTTPRLTPVVVSYPLLLW